MNNPSLHPIAKAIYRGEIIIEKVILSLKKAGGGGQGEVFFLDDRFVVKLVYEYKQGDHNP